ncbi:hypothetical protein SERLA73DRAFT_63004 [Serpula lacrymans var. lacrymans S7.3]|uniref:Uncharacterized protein n=2 Tax=Serpula lacrymans var. lacrymans TaxID=341189 RepID=F8QC30_SERL3|nr:hypothetical protein SERLA73DRAFT_63004 [Serpula lacrymans var. lacrymans S7.3]
MPGETPVTITELVAQKDRIYREEKELKVKYAKVKAFQGLPPNLELARIELIQAQDEQMRLVQLRERLLGRMADAVS